MNIVSTEIKAKDLMSADPICVEPSTTIRELARLFEENEISGAPVTNPEGRVIGVVTKTDLIRRCSAGTDDVPPAYLFEVLADQGDSDESREVVPEPLICVEDFMTEDPQVVPAHLPASTVAQLMFQRRIHRVIVVDEDRFPIGIITSLDLLGAFPAEPAP